MMSELEMQLLFLDAQERKEDAKKTKPMPFPPKGKKTKKGKDC